MDERKENATKSLLMYLGVLNIPFFAFSLLVFVEALIDDLKHSLFGLIFPVGIATSFYFAIHRNRYAVWANVIIILTLSFTYFASGWYEIAMLIVNLFR